MPEVRAPGVHVAEIEGPPPPIAWPATGVAGFAAEGPALGPRRVASAAEVAAVPALAAAAAAFRAEGGRSLWLAQAPDIAAAVAALAAVPGVDLLAAPGLPDAAAALIAAAADAPRLALIDPPPGLDAAGVAAFRATLGDAPDAALFWPWLDGPGGPVPPSAVAAGQIAAQDGRRGVHAAAAGVALAGGLTPALALTDADQQALTPQGINAIRAFPGRGTVLWGARTLGADPEARHVPVRRLLRHVEAAAIAGLGPALFEPNAPPLHARVRAALAQFLDGLWRGGALAGSRPEEGYGVRCGLGETMTEADLGAGRLVAEIALAPQRPAEFILRRITLSLPPG